MESASPSARVFISYRSQDPDLSIDNILASVWGLIEGLLAGRRKNESQRLLSVG